MKAGADPVAADPLLAVAGLSSGYGEALVVRDVSFRLDGGEILTLLGKNGMGKTTLLKGDFQANLTRAPSRLCRLHLCAEQAQDSADEGEGTLD